MTAGITAVWLTLNAWDGTAVDRAFGAVTSSFIYTLLLGVMDACSGIIMWTEWRKNPIEESEYGEWTTRQLFHSLCDDLLYWFY